MHGRLTSNVMKFGAHIKAMEEQLRSSRKEHKEVKLLLRQLEQGKTEAIAELTTTVKGMCSSMISLMIYILSNLTFTLCSYGILLFFFFFFFFLFFLEKNKKLEKK